MVAVVLAALSVPFVAVALQSPPGAYQINNIGWWPVGIAQAMALAASSVIPAV